MTTARGTAKIFLIGKDEENLTPMEETAYETEDVLQTALARYPDLLAGDQIDPEDPRRWLLVAREVGIPGDVDETGRWSLDHLFLDQDGVPTFIECKRASDTRSRREVIAQMLDYAANGTVYWDMSDLRQAAAETAKGRNRLLDDEIRALMRDDAADVEGFWQKVADNLRHGKVRLVFVADRTPKELRRLVEFLNEKMADVEVLAVEIKQFKGKDQRALVPRVVGLTEEAKDRKTGDGRSGTTGRGRFLSTCPPETRSLFEMILDQAVSRGYIIYWGKVGFSVRARLSKEQRVLTFAYGWPSGNFQVYLGLLPIPDTENKALRQKLMTYGIFREAGEKTLDAKLDAKAIAKMPEVYEFLLEQMDRIIVSEY
ncbi:MAG: hypothetical protein M1570_00865 [Chloroflexi bacterium]|nr:hypothetical protein [Chloroflexota bacterium]